MGDTLYVGRDIFPLLLLKSQVTRRSVTPILTFWVWVRTGVHEVTEGSLLVVFIWSSPFIFVLWYFRLTPHKLPQLSRVGEWRR